MTDSLTLLVRNAEDAIAPACHAADQWLHVRNIPPRVRYLVNLTIEELVSNCIKHAYDDALEHTIEFVLTVTELELTILVVDDGREFDPSRAPHPNISQAIEHRPIGGLGIHLLRQLSDTMSYERRDDQNRLTLTKSLA